jgi:DNA segregation ATPase FtsK/SpoIIIE-like protein
MKNEQHQTARELYFNTNLSKTEIAERLNITRRTVYQWSVDGNWDKLRESARHMPAILAEKCYYLIGHFTDHLLSAESRDMAITKQEVDMLHKLTMTANKLKKGSTVADNMETFTYFLERIQRTDPELAEQVAPHVTGYITARRGKDECSFLLDGFDETGHLPYPEKENEEKLLDESEATAILAEQQEHQQSASQPVTQQQKQGAATQPSKSAQQQAPSHKPPYSGARAYEPIRPVHTPLRAGPIASPGIHATAKAA